MKKKKSMAVMFTPMLDLDFCCFCISKTNLWEKLDIQNNTNYFSLYLYWVVQIHNANGKQKKKNYKT